MNKKTGFTLIELLAVVLIIAILTAVALPQYRRAIQRTQATEALTNLRTIFDSAMRYRAAHSENPTNAAALDVNFFEATHSGSYSDIGFFRYFFYTNGVSACMMNKTVGKRKNEDGDLEDDWDDEGHAKSMADFRTFCLSMNYTQTTKCENQFGPGSIFCQNNSGFKSSDYVCNYLGRKIVNDCSTYVIE